jgi:hypothetical protein
MLARLCVALLLLASSIVLRAQAADLSVTASVTPRFGLALGDELLVRTQVVNRGPGPAQSVNVSVVGIPFQLFPFEIVASETSGCAVDFLDIDPVVFNYLWIIGTMPAASERSCVVRLRVRAVPANGTTTLTAQATSIPRDPTFGDNTVTLPVAFGASTPTTIPASSTGLLAVFIGLILGSLVFARIDALK